MAKVQPEIESFARIKVIGVGGSGKNALNHMINSKVRGVDFIAVNTDVQDLHHSLASKKIHIGKSLTKGQGAGMNPDIGKRSAEETKEEVSESLKGADMVFIACGMGGGTGTGASPVIAKIAKDEGILTVAVVTKPFFFEGRERMRLAEKGLEELEKSVDALIVIPNDKILSIVDKNTPANAGFAMCDEILRQAVEGISELITTTGKINVDFADIRSIMQDAGTALMGVGRASGDTRAKDAATMAINSPLLDVSIQNARGVLYVITGGDDLTMPEIADASRIITESIDKDAKVIFGYNQSDTVKKGEIQVTVIATGFPNQNLSKKEVTASSFSPAVKDKVESLTIDRTERKQINNSLVEDSVVPLRTRETPHQSITRETKKEETPLVIDEDEEDDDWSAVPAFLRRKK
jgi:cell division protein FtsZ